jgi:hypothetical protein
MTQSAESCVSQKRRSSASLLNVGIGLGLCFDLAMDPALRWNWSAQYSQNRWLIHVRA